MRSQAHQIADPDGDKGLYTGPVDKRGRANGLGKLEYDQVAQEHNVFVGDFMHGEMWEGVVFDTASSEPVAKNTLRDGAWTDSMDLQIVARHPFTGQAAEARTSRTESTQHAAPQSTMPRPSGSQHAEPEVQNPASGGMPAQEPPAEDNSADGANSRLPGKMHQQISPSTEPFMAEGSPYMVAFVVVMFAGLAASGVLERPQGG